MGLAGQARVVATGTAWRLTGADAAGRALAEAAAHGGEAESMLAGMMLARGGDRGVDVVREMVERGERDPVLVDVVASIATPHARALLTEMAVGDDELGAAAREVLATLDAIPDATSGPPADEPPDGGPA